MAEVYRALRLGMRKCHEFFIAEAERDDVYKGLHRSKNILIVDDCSDLLHILGKCFAIYADGYNILTASDGGEATRVLESIPVDILLTDLDMPVMDGRELAGFVMKNYPYTQIFAMSGIDEQISRNKLDYLGISACIRKPFGISDLIAAVLNGQCEQDDPQKVAYH